MPHACSQGVLLRSPWGGKGLLGQPVTTGRHGLDLRKAAVRSRTDKKVSSCLTSWELAFVCSLSYQFFSVVSPNSVSGGNSTTKDACLGWLKGIPAHSVASGSSPALRARLSAAPGRREPRVTQLCRCISHTSGCVLLRGPTPRCWSDPTSQQSAEPSSWVKAGMVLHIILLIPRRFAKLHEIRCVFTVAICYVHVRLLVLVTCACAGAGQPRSGISACPFRGRSNHYTELRNRGSSQITSRCSSQARKYRPHAGGSSNYHTWPAPAQVLYERFEWEAAATGSPGSLCAGFSGDVTQAPPSTGRRVQPELWAAVVAAVASHTHRFEACICAFGSGFQTWASSGRGGEDGLRTRRLPCMDEKGQGPGWWERRWRRRNERIQSSDGDTQVQEMEKSGWSR